MDLRSGEKLTEHICKRAHERFVECLSTLRIREVQAIKDCLSYDIVKFLEELLLCLLIKPIILDKRKRHIIGRYTIEQKFLMLLELWLLHTDLTNDVPESVRNQRVSMLLLKQL